jgi:hypothetical protein
LLVEPLEDRAVPANFTVATVPDLIGAMTTANQTADADTITLSPGKTFTLNAAIRIGFGNNSYYSYTGLPLIAAAGGSLTIVGNGDVVERSAAKGTPAFHLFMVDTGASLTLENLTLQGGLSYSSARWDVDSGGAINNRGALTLRSVTVQNNVVQGNAGCGALGGGIYSDGTLSLENCTIRNNQALGGAGFWYRSEFGSWGVNGGYGVGGGVYIAGGPVTLLGTTITGNFAKGGAGKQGTQSGLGIGGGLFIDSDAVAYLDAFTVDHVKNNKASSDPDISGAYTVLP